MTFEEFLGKSGRKLSPEQAEAVYSDKSTVVSAGAGSGKTMVLALRFVRLVLQGKAHADEILTLTFTKKAAGEMYERIHSMLLAAGADEELLHFFPRARISTMDSFWSEIARTDSMRYGVMRDFTLLEDDDAEDMARRIFIDMEDDAALRSSLLSAFCSRRDSSLFALSSFWEGIDAPGDTLRLVIIVKLPFSVPTAPIEAARSMNIEKRGGRVFFEMSLPEATLKLKQGLGRLIRSEEDRGVVLILDNRILSHGYGRIMLNSFPECYIPEDVSTGNIASKIENFLY